jgi:hypothetical protein
VHVVRRTAITRDDSATELRVVIRAITRCAQSAPNQREDHSVRPREENAATLDTLEALWPRRSSIEAVVLIEGENPFLRSHATTPQSPQIPLLLGAPERML